MKRTIYWPPLALICGQVFANPTVSLNIGPQPLESALRQFSQQTGMQVLFASGDVSDEIQAPAVSGTVSPEVGLRHLLSASNLQYKFVNARTVAIRPIATLATTSEGGAKDSPVATSAPVAGTTPNGDASEQGVNPSTGLPQILIRGSRSLDADIQRTRDDVRPYVVFDRETIEKSAAENVGDLLKQRLTMNYARQQPNQLSNFNTGDGNQSLISLRGLANTETLVLVDGRRVSARRSGANELQSDLNSIPLSAIERIEVLPASAAGIYGGNATGGVINVVLRRDYSGIESTLGFESSFAGGGATRNADLYTGFHFNGNRTSVLVAGSYADANPLLAADRDFYAENYRRSLDNTIAANPSAFYNTGSPILGATTNISSARVGLAAPNLVLKSGQALGSPITFVPTGYLGPASDGGAALVANAGKYNSDLADSGQSNGGRAGLLGAPTTGSLSLTIRHELTESIETFMELSGAREDQYFDVLPISTTFQIPTSSPSNPFKQNIMVNAPLAGASAVVQSRFDDRRVLAGTKSRLPHDWSFALDYSFSTNTTLQSLPATRLLNAATSAVASGSVNVLQDARSYTDNILAFIVPSGSIAPSRSRLSDTTARVAGPIASLRAGDIVLSTLLEHSAQHFGEWSSTVYASNGVPSTTSYSDGLSATNSAYAEVRLPFASESRPLFRMRSAELQVAGRFDRYSRRAIRQLSPASASTDASEQVFSSFDPSVGLRFSPLRDVTFRASYGDGFLPPYLSQLQELAPTVGNVSFLGLTDPKRGGEPIVGLVTTQGGGNPDLRPEKSRSSSAGLILTPRVVPNFRLSLDWIRIRKRDDITQLFLQQTNINNEDVLPGFVIRGPAQVGDPFSVGKIIGFDQRYINATKAVSESYDIALDYLLNTGSFGALTFASSITKLVHATLQTSPLVSELDQAGTANAPKWAANATLSWSRGRWSASWTSRYLDSYWLTTAHSFNVAQGSDHVPSAFYHDLAAQFDFASNRSDMQILSNVVVRFGVKNVFDNPPRYSVVDGGVYDRWSDPRMATYFISLKKSFGD